MVILILLAGAGGAACAADADGILAQARTSGGLAVVIGDTAEIAADVGRRGTWLVQILAPSRGVDAVRAGIPASLTGRVSVMGWEPGDRLPYLSDLVTLLVVDRPPVAGAVSPAEASRVVHPGGAMATRTATGWAVSIEPMPAEFGEWTHYFAKPDANPSNGDRAVAGPTGIQWLTGWQSTREVAAANGYRIGGGVAVSEEQLDLGKDRDAVAAQHIVGRSAWNGLLQWRMPYPKRDGAGKTRPMVISGGRLFTYLGGDTVTPSGKVLDSVPNGALAAIDLTNGAVVKTYDQALPVTWQRDSEDRHKGRGYAGGNLIAAGDRIYHCVGDAVQAIEMDSGRVVWTWRPGPGLFPDLPAFDATTQRLVIGVGTWPRLLGRNPMLYCRQVVALEAQSGRMAWSIAPPDDPVRNNPDWTKGQPAPGKKLSQILIADGRVFLYRAGGMNTLKVQIQDGVVTGPADRYGVIYLAAVALDDGRTLWAREGYEPLFRDQWVPTGQPRCG